MTTRSDFLAPAISEYLVAHAPPRDALLEELAEETSRLGDPAGMQVGHDEAAFLAQLVRLSRARSAVEIGTFTGYSSICIARALPRGGRLLCCDVSAEWTAVARRYWRRAGLLDRIELRLAPALETLRSLSRERHLDYAFVDGEKTEYIEYYEELVPRMTPHGVIVVDNVLWSGTVADPAVDAPLTVAVRAFNDHVTEDPRTEAVMLAVADGITVIMGAQDAQA